MLRLYKLLLDGKVDTLVTLAADTVADILGTDTNTNFPNANVVMGTDGDDTITGTSGSDLIASFGGTDTVNALAGNDKISRWLRSRYSKRWR